MPPRKTPTVYDGPDAATAELLQAAFRYALSLSASPIDAEDLVQEGWLRARERYGTGADRKIVFRVVRNLYIDGWRRASRFPTVELSTTGNDEIQLIDNDASRDPERSCGEGVLGQHLADLRDTEREALLLSVVEGYSAREIADLTDSTRGTVLSLIHRAKLKIQKALDTESGDKESDNKESDDKHDEGANSLRLVVPPESKRLKR